MEFSNPIDRIRHARESIDKTISQYADKRYAKTYETGYRDGLQQAEYILTHTKPSTADRSRPTNEMARSALAPFHP